MSQSREVQLEEDWVDGLANLHGIACERHTDLEAVVVLRLFQDGGVGYSALPRSRGLDLTDQGLADEVTAMGLYACLGGAIRMGKDLDRVDITVAPLEKLQQQVASRPRPLRPPRRRPR